VTPARITPARRHSLRPPFVALVADITLRNDDAEPRWWLVATAAGPDIAPLGSVGVHSVELGRTARFAGAAPFGALRLDAGEEVTLHDWLVTVWNDPPLSGVEVDVVDAAEVIIGGSPIADWLARGTWPGEQLEVFPVELVRPRRATMRLAM
jgi:hypothetical protein